MTKRKITIQVEFPERATEDDVASFVADSLEWAGGCRHPEDPMFHSLRVFEVKIGRTTYENESKKELP